VERTIVTGSNIPTVTEEAAQASVQETAPALANRKLIRNATVELEIVGFDNAVQKITAFGERRTRVRCYDRFRETGEWKN